jgi:hypothetical protein
MILFAILKVVEATVASPPLFDSGDKEVGEEVVETVKEMERRSKGGRAEMWFSVRPFVSDTKEYALTTTAKVVNASSRNLIILGPPLSFYIWIFKSSYNILKL